MDRNSLFGRGERLNQRTRRKFTFGIGHLILLTTLVAEAIYYGRAILAFVDVFYSIIAFGLFLAFCLLGVRVKTPAIISIWLPIGIVCLIVSLATWIPNFRCQIAELSYYDVHGTHTAPPVLTQLSILLEPVDILRIVEFGRWSYGLAFEYTCIAASAFAGFAFGRLWRTRTTNRWPKQATRKGWDLETNSNSR